MYDTLSYQNGTILNLFDFTYSPSRYESYSQGKLTSEGRLSGGVSFKKIVKDGQERTQVSFEDSFLKSIFQLGLTFDIFGANNSRMMFMTLPQRTNVENIALQSLPLSFGYTRDYKNFTNKEPYACSLFALNGNIAKISFSFSNPEKLIELY